MKISGVDLSLTSTGLATVTDGVLATCLVTSAAPKPATHRPVLTVRFARQTSIAKRVLAEVKGSELVIIENLFLGKAAGDLMDRAGLWWRIVGALIVTDVPVYTVAATSAKKFLAGAGNADKGSMVRSAGKLWPDWEPSSPAATEDEADAIALVSMGLALLGKQDFPMPDYRTEALGKLEATVKLAEQAQ